MPLNATRSAALRDRLEVVLPELRRVLRAMAHSHAGLRPVLPNRPTPTLDSVTEVDDGPGIDDAPAHSYYLEQGPQTGVDDLGNPVYSVVPMRAISWRQVHAAFTDATAQTALRYILRRTRAWIDTADARRKGVDDLAGLGAILRIQAKDATGTIYEAAKGFGILDAASHGWVEVPVEPAMSPPVPPAGMTMKGEESTEKRKPWRERWRF